MQLKKLLRKLHTHLNQNGMVGFINYFEQSNHQLLTRILLIIDKEFIGALQFAKDWVHFESQIEKKSVPVVAKSIFDYLGLEIPQDELPDEFSQPGQPAILLGLNHEAVVEPIILISLLNRDDIKFPGMKVFQYLGPNISEYILPLLPKKVAIDYSGNTKPSISNKLDPFYQLYCLEDKSIEEIGRLNQSSLHQAAGHLAEGGALIIFPNGGRSINCPWYQGIGQIISRLPPEVITSVPIFPISLSGLTRKMIYRKIHKAAFNQQKVTPICLKIYEPIYMPRWAVSASPKRLLDYLRKEAEMRLHTVSNPVPNPCGNSSLISSD
jgi:hypothetical protein